MNMNPKNQRNGGGTDRSRLGTERAAVLLASMALLSAVAPVGATSGRNVAVEQTASTTTVAPGGTVTVEVGIDGRGLNAPAVAVTLPDGWSVLSQSATGPAVYKPNTTEWVWLEGGDYTVRYTVRIPRDADAGDYAIRAEGSAIVPDTDERVTAATRTAVTVETSRHVETTDAETATAATTATGGDPQAAAPSTATGDAGASNESTAGRVRAGVAGSQVTETVLSDGVQVGTTVVSTRQGPTRTTDRPSKAASVAEDGAETAGDTTRTSDGNATGSTPGFGAVPALVALVLVALFGRR